MTDVFFACLIVCTWLMNWLMKFPAEGVNIHMPKEGLLCLLKCCKATKQVKFSSFCSFFLVGDLIDELTIGRCESLKISDASGRLAFVQHTAALAQRWLHFWGVVCFCVWTACGCLTTNDECLLVLLLACTTWCMLAKTNELHQLKVLKSRVPQMD